MFFSFFYSCFFIILTLAFFISIEDCFFLTEITFIVFFVALIIKSIKRNGLIHAYTFFLLFSMFFMFSRFIFDIFGYADVLKISFPSDYTVRPTSGVILIFLCLIIYTLIDCGYFYSHVKFLKRRYVSFSEGVYKTLVILLIVTLPLILYKNYLRFKYVQTVGYISYTLNPEDVNLPVYLNGVGWIFNVIFFALLTCSRTNYKTKFLWFLYLLVSLFDSLKGNRASFAINFVLCIYFSMKQTRLSTKKITKILFFSFIFFLLFYVLVTSLRDTSKQYTSFNLLSDLLFSLFYDQSVSLNVPLLYIDCFDVIQNGSIAPFVITDYLKYCFGSSVFDTSVLLHQIIYTPKGFGLGYALLVEIFNLGIFGIPFCLGIGWFIKFTEKNFFRNTYFIGFFCLCFMSIIYMPRHIFFDFISPIRLSWVVSGLIMISIFSFFFRWQRSSGKRGFV